MGGIFSTLSKQLLGNLFLSAGLPAVAFVAGFATLIAPRLPASWAPRVPALLEPEWPTAIAALAVLLVAALLSALNGQIIRLFEGYPFADSWIGRKLEDRHRERACEAETWWRGVRGVLRAVYGYRGSAAPDEVRVAKLDALWNETAQDLSALYPTPDRVLPTRFGNLVRAFEDYPSDRYGIYGVTTWPRLVGVLDSDFAQQVADTKQPLDLMVNGAVVSASLGLCLFVSGLAWPAHQGASWEAWGLWGAAIAAFGGAAHLFYRSALGRAAAWGDMVKAAFDLYRWDLLEKLGVEERPSDMEEEQELWQALGHHMGLARMTTAAPLVYRRPSDEKQPDPPWWARWLEGLERSPR